jgi:hypothetical protein
VTPEQFKAMIAEKFKSKIYQEVDGYYVVDLSGSYGFMDPSTLRAVADLLDEMNAPWHAQCMADPRISEGARHG